MNKPKPQDVTSYDIIKAVAVVIMICDHIGYYFYPDNLWWRAVGRIGFPVWFFLPGYAQGRGVGKSLWVGGLMLVAGNLIVGLPLLPVNALFTIIMIRLSVDSITKLVHRQEPLFWGVCLLLILLYVPTNAFAEYGSLGVLFGLFGWLVRNVDKVENGVRKKTRFGIFAFLTFLILQQWMPPSGFHFSPAQFFVMAFCTAGTCWALFNFRAENYPGFAVRAGKPLTWLTKFLGRRTLEIYVFHLLLFKAILLCQYPQNFLQSGLVTSHGHWDKPPAVHYENRKASSP